MDDELGEAFRAAVSDFSRKVAEATENGLREAVARNACPQCNRPVHPETLIVFNVPPRVIGVMTYQIVIACMWCAELVREKLREH